MDIKAKKNIIKVLLVVTIVLALVLQAFLGPKHKDSEESGFLKKIIEIIIK